ncbi:unnamed protein product [Dicrocoelium dendriticum]|nr:unnamed protein product [Dicrocoelium dendriticum]
MMRNENKHTLTSYQCRRNKSVLVFSSLHSNSSVQDSGKKKPETVLFYNSTKYGVDVLDQMTRALTVKSSSRRWPVQVFFNVLDLAGINSWIIYNSVCGTKISRRSYLVGLSEELLTCIHHTRYVTTGITTNNSAESGSRVNIKRRQCQIGYCKGNKSQNKCSVCEKIVCGSCGQIERVITCFKCKLE